MMEILIPATDKTPKVILRPDGMCEISGKSIPEDAEVFYSPILKWLENYVANPAAKTHLIIDLEYFNISSSKRILFILYKLNELVSRNIDVRVSWKYDDNDEDMYEVGQDYAFMVKIPFDFQEIDRVKAHTKHSALSA